MKQGARGVCRQQRHASSHQRKAAEGGDGAHTKLQQLAQEVEPMMEGTGIFLVGMMGCGKSTVADELAKALGYSKLDSDDVIEKVAEKRIPQIFEDDGEDGFRQLENSVLQELTAFKRCVISTGGGAASNANNWMHLQNGIVVFLDVHVDKLTERVLADGAASTRPMLQGADPSETEEEYALIDRFLTFSLSFFPASVCVPNRTKPNTMGIASLRRAVARRLTEIMEERRPWYEQADVHVAISRDAPQASDAVAERVLEQVKQRVQQDDTRERVRHGSPNVHEMHTL